MNITIIDIIDYSKIDEFISNKKNTLFYNSNNYLKFIEKIANCNAKIALLKDGTVNKAILPFCIKKGVYGDVLNSLPFYGSNGGIICDSQEYYDVMVDWYNNYSNQFAASTIVCSPFDVFNKDKIEYNHFDERIGQFTFFDGVYNTLEELMELFHYKTRNTIRKSIKCGVSVKVDNNNIDFIKNVHWDNLKTIGGIPKSATFFDNIKNYFQAGKDYDIYIAYLENKPIAGLLLFYYKGFVEYYTPVVISEYRNYQALSLIIAQAMLDSSKNGRNAWNWGGTWKTQDGVYQFKSRWGTQDLMYKYLIKVNNPDIYQSEPQTLLSEYENFYVLPFNLLSK